MSPRWIHPLDTLIAVIVLELALLGVAGSIGSCERLLARGRPEAALL